MPDEKDIIIVGGGWSGLSCAIELAAQNQRVTLLEAARQLGGRARCIAFDKQSVDNGQHFFIGAYLNTFALLEKINLPVSKIFRRRPLSLSLQYCDGINFQIKTPRLLSPLNLLVALFNSKGFTLKERWQAIRFGRRLFTNSIILKQDVSVLELLKSEKQTDNLITCLWSPFCLATLNTRIHEASAQIFMRILRDTFCKSHQHTDLILPKVNLGALLPDTATQFIESHNGNIYLDHEVKELLLDKRRVVGVKLDNKTIHAQHVVLAAPAQVTQELLKPHTALHDVAYNISGFSYESIVTIYFQYPTSVRPDQALQGTLGTTMHWVVDRHIAGQAGMIAVVISGNGPHLELDDGALVELISDELSECFPHWPRAENSLIIRENQATFSAQVGVNALRPDNATAVDGLWLAGDYTNTGYPARIEGAVKSGLRCARLILATMN